MIRLFNKVKTNTVCFADNRIVPGNLFEWLLLPFIVGLLTLSHLPGFSKIMVVYGFGFGALYVLNILYFKKRPNIPPEVILYLLWIAWSLTGMINAPDRSVYWQGLTTLLQMAVMIIVIAGITATYRNLNVVLAAILIGGLIVALSGFVSGEFQLASELESKSRATGLTNNANSFAYSLLFIIFSSVYFFRHNRGLLKQFVLAGFFVCAVVGIVYSGSRKGFLGLLFFIALLFFLTKGKYLLRKPLYSFLLFTSLFSVVYAGTNFVLARTYLGKRMTYTASEGAPTRVQMYKEGFELIRQYPLTGVGLNNYRVFSSFGKYSHSDYIEVAANTGLVGCALYFAVYLLLWLRLKRLKSRYGHVELTFFIAFAKASIFTILVLGFGRPNIASKITWCFLAALVGYSWAIEKSLRSIDRGTAKVCLHSH